MSLYPRQLLKAQFLLVHFRLRSLGWPATRNVRVKAFLHRHGQQIPVCDFLVRTPPNERRNAFAVVRIDRRFHPGQYRLWSAALIGDREYPSTTLASDLVSVGEGPAAAPFRKELPSCSPAQVMALYLGAMERANLAKIAAFYEREPNPGPPALGLDSLEVAVVQDASCLDQWIRHRILKFPRTPSARRLASQNIAAGELLLAAYRLRDLPRILSLLQVPGRA